MKRTIRDKSVGENRISLGKVNFRLTAASLAALISTFLLNYADFGFEINLIIFSVITVAYLVFYFAVDWQQKVELNRIEKEREAETINAEIENRLLALEEANEFFGASLKSADLLRLVASRVKELIPFAACAFYVADASKTRLKIEFAQGKNAQKLKNLEFSIEKGNAGRAFASGTVRADKTLSAEKEVVAPDVLTNFSSAIAVPLRRGGESFGVLQLYGDTEVEFNESSVRILEAVGERTAPLFAGTLAFEQSLSNALTDSLTTLPNERAFFLVLETQIAEAVRFQTERPLTVLAIDLKNFNELNQQFGHATGDRVLAFAGQTIKKQLRQMDFLARSAGDEFLVVLPTATESVAREVIERIERAFVTKPFEIAAGEKAFLEFNFGSATFGQDGEIAAQMLNAALLKKRQKKSGEPNKILWFPQEYAN